MGWGLACLGQKDVLFRCGKVHGVLGVGDCAGCCVVTSVEPKFSISAGVNSSVPWYIMGDFLSDSPMSGSLSEVGGGVKGQHGHFWLLSQSYPYVFSRFVNLLPH